MGHRGDQTINNHGPLTDKEVDPEERQMQTKVLHPILLSLLMALLGCQTEEFGQASVQSRERVFNSKEYSNLKCSQSTLMKPKVDILFLFDNSTSSFFLNATSRQAILDPLKKIIRVAGQRFDFRLMVAPLIGSSPTSGVALAVENEKGMNSTSKRLVVEVGNQQLIEKAASIPPTSGSNEYGFERAINLVKYHRNTGVFRSKAYTLVTIFSNEDADWRQSGPDHGGAGPEKEDFKTNLKNFKQLSRGLKALQFRLLTVVPRRDRCMPHSVNGTRYRRMSKELYFDNLSRSQGKQPYHNSYDNFDLCSENYRSIFDKITKTITSVLVGHRYDYWPVSAGTQLAIDPDSIKVFKHINDTNVKRIPKGRSNGWEFENRYQTQNTRFFPTSGEPFSGRLIKLNGNARVSFPECLRIETTDPRDYFGYYVALEKPKLDTVVYKKNGKEIGQDTKNGWEYLGFRSDLNTRIEGPANDSSASPAVSKTGHVFKLHGDAIYSNGDTVEFTFLPAPP